MDVWGAHKLSLKEIYKIFLSRDDKRLFENSFYKVKISPTFIQVTESIYDLMGASYNEKEWQLYMLINTWAST
jgi:hypothetical protein